MNWLLVFAALFLLDFVYARYNLATAERRVWASAHYAAIIILLGGFGVVSYSQDHVLLIPAACGAWCGTFSSVWWSARSIKFADPYTIIKRGED
jgi:hypothetical protein